MIVDNSLVVSGSTSGNTVTGQTVTGNNVVVVSTNIVDLSQARDIGAGELMRLSVQVVTDAEGSDAIEIQAVTCDNTGLITDFDIVGSSGAITNGLLTKGSRFVINLNPLIGSIGKRYLGVRYLITGAATAGAFFASFGICVQDGQKYYPAAI